MYAKNPLLLIELFGWSPMDESKLDHKKIEKLLKYPDLLNALDEWIIFPDRNLLPKLKQLSQIVDRLYNFNYQNSKIYRGFSKNNNYQDKMDLIDKHFLFNSLKKDVKPGYEFRYKVTNPISFTTNVNIAKDFGSIVVESNLPKHNKLVITNELNYIILKMYNNLKPNKSQYEVIVFPDNTLNCRVIST